MVNYNRNGAGVTPEIALEPEEQAEIISHAFDVTLLPANKPVLTQHDVAKPPYHTRVSHDDTHALGFWGTDIVERTWKMELGGAPAHCAMFVERDRGGLRALRTGDRPATLVCMAQFGTLDDHRTLRVEVDQRTLQITDYVDELVQGGETTTLLDSRQQPELCLPENGTAGTFLNAFIEAAYPRTVEPVLV